MLKILSVLIVIGTIIGGIFYAVNSDPENPAHALFRATLKEFPKHASTQNKEYLTSQKMRSATSRFIIKKVAEDAENSIIDMQVSGKRITLTYLDDKGPFAGQTIVLEPSIKGSSVVWKCINGSVLVRVRTKNCRLGYGHSLSEMSDL